MERIFLQKFENGRDAEIMTGDPRWGNEHPPGGCPITQSRKFFSIFAQSRTYFPTSTQSYILVKISTFTQSRTYFFRYHAISQIRKGFSRRYAHQKDILRITHTCQFHAITQLFSHFHAITHNHATKKGHSRNHATLWGAS